jgi:Ca2+-transporting ATPase
VTAVPPSKSTDQPAVPAPAAERGNGRWHTLTPEAAAALLESSPQTGLTADEASARLARHGPNELPAAAGPSPLTLFLRQFESVIIWVLIAAAVISGVLREWVDAVAIGAILLLNATLGFFQEFRAERSLAALSTMVETRARVIRGGTAQGVPAREVVPGDLIEIEAGDRIPADARLLRASVLRTDEAVVTGESTPVTKEPEAILPVNVALGDRRNLLFMGTMAVSGRGVAMVVSTGASTEFGRIAALLTVATAEKTPLQQRLARLGTALLQLSLGVAIVVLLAGWIRGAALFDMFLVGVSLAVAAVPEGLPAIVTITLALGVARMVKRHALIRRLPAVETLGSTTVICTDKTGTLTKGEMTVTRLFVPGGTVEVSGEGYTPEGAFLLRDGTGPTGQDRRAVDELLTASLLCNHAVLKHTEGGWRVLGDPTEGALVVAASKAGLSREHLEAAHPVVAELPFDPERKRMSVICRDADAVIVFAKGAPDVLIPRCSFVLAGGSVQPLDESRRRELLDVNDRFSAGALRVLAVARRSLPEMPAQLDEASLEQELVFLGLVAMRDPPRPEAKAAIRACRQAGIRTVMITGDHWQTAVAVGRELELMDGGASALTGAELAAMSDEELRARVTDTAIYARVSAEDKLRIVKAWRARGAVVAMTGDGVNDAPALRSADIGIAMGLTGTDVARQAADMVVTDDNFASIAAAVDEGRTIYGNIRRSIHYLLSCNASELLVMLLAILLAQPLPLLPVQILWINLVSDGFPALALAVEPAHEDAMRRPPRPPGEAVLTRPRIRLIARQGFFLAVFPLLLFVVSLRGGADLVQARTVLFSALVFSQLSHAFNCRSDTALLLDLGISTNRPLLYAVTATALLQAGIVLVPAAHQVLDITTLTPAQWGLAVTVGVMPVAGMELEKVWRRWRRPPETRPHS